MSTTFTRLVGRLPIPMIRASIVRSIVAAGESLGSDRDGLLRTAGLEEADLSSLDAQLPALVGMRLLRRLERDHPNVSLGLHVARHAPSSTFSTLGYAMRQAESMREAMHVVQRFVRLLSTDASVILEETAHGDVPLVLNHNAIIARMRHPIEIGIASAYAIFEHSLRPGDVTAVTFAHDPTGPVEEYEAFFGVRPEFHAAKNSVVVGHHVLDQPVPETDAALFRHLTELLQGTADFAPVEDVEIGRALFDCVERGAYRVDALAEQAGMAERTLHRKLARHGLTPRELLEDARFDAAQKLLSDGRTPIPDVAFLLGYSDERALARAFKRWAGTTPGKYRRARAV